MIKYFCFNDHAYRCMIIGSLLILIIQDRQWVVLQVGKLLIMISVGSYYFSPLIYLWWTNFDLSQTGISSQDILFDNAKR